MRRTRPSWKPSGPSHRRSPSHRASDFLTHPNRHLIAFRLSVQGLWTLISSYCIHPSLLCRGTLSLRHSSPMHSDAARGRPTYTLPTIRNTTTGAQDNGSVDHRISRSILPCHMARLTVLHHLPALPSIPSPFTLFRSPYHHQRTHETEFPDCI
jgi:hypothetical protein